MRLVINAIPTTPGGGLTVLIGLLRGLHKIGATLDIHVVSAHADTTAKLRTVDGVTCHSIADSRTSWALRVSLSNLTFGRWARRLGADVVLTNNHYLFGVQCPLVVHHHNVKRFLTPDLGVREPASLANWLRDWAARVALRRATANVFVSDFLRRQAESFVPGSAPRNYVVRNGVDDDVIDAAASIDVPFAERYGRLAALQTANPHKDNATMIRSLAELVRLAPDIDWQLHVAGSDGRGSWLPFRELARSLDVDDRIHWRGFCHLQELDEILRHSACLIATSVLEAGPLPGLEALARKCVPVAARIPPRQEFLGDAGVLVEPRNPAQFAAAIVALHRDPQRWRGLSEGGVGHVRGFAWSRRAAEFLEVLKRATSSQPPSS